MLFNPSWGALDGMSILLGINFGQDKKQKSGLFASDKRRFSIAALTLTVKVRLKAKSITCWLQEFALLSYFS